MQSTQYIALKRPYSNTNTIIPALIAMGVAMVAALVIVLVSNDAFESYPYIYLLPWAAGLAVLLTIPSLILYYRGKFTFADPLIFATWSYFFPGFVIGGVFFAGGWSQPVFLALIQDFSYTMPLTFTLVGVGFASMAVGYFLPIGSKLGTTVAKRLPQADYPLDSYIAPGVLLLSLGVLNTIIAFAIGLFGFQRSIEINSYDGLVFLTTLFWMQASFLLWYIIFRQRRLRFIFIPVLAMLVTTAVTKSIFAGNRGTIIQIFTTVVLAFILSGRRFGGKQLTVASLILAGLLFIGMIYGTTFRMVKGGEEQLGAGQYVENVFETFDHLGRSDMNQSMEFGFESIAGRVDAVSMLAVVVSSYEQLQPYEEAYGLDNNIFIESTTFFIPRIIWSDKPTVSDARRYSDLYFNWGESSFIITPIGDLLRNFGMIGVPIGMLILGIVLRFIYSSLVEGQKPSIWRYTLYFMLLTSISYEGFYATIIPNMFKIGVVAVAGMVIVVLIARRLSPTLNAGPRPV